MGVENMCGACVGVVIRMGVVSDMKHVATYAEQTFSSSQA